MLVLVKDLYMDTQDAVIHIIDMDMASMADTEESMADTTEEADTITTVDTDTTDHHLF